MKALLLLKNNNSSIQENNCPIVATLQETASTLMLARFFKTLFRLLVLELLSARLARWAHSSRVIRQKNLSTWVVGGMVLAFLVSLMCCALLFGFLALALYLNTVFGSSYLGFLLVSGGCVGLLLLLLLLAWLRWYRSA